ncbi:hypothetical protein GOARA_048_00930 [Gordonia araii NBRC 100433]|uniref:IrrE N-terminal-like domain-containing protein n=1 Tax=Gordonia araii NBRC 100433 TaxID=1073574 RepID=G7H216_9ACTN|nr:hypothetical protein [Gordonia araii]NNG97224.1 hypothetical protein [Gordonia araii NBRC 100433]GAB09891.1 hypothetical protein GOARA_048_00930 [Gordonia araii NBRC 100433]
MRSERALRALCRRELRGLDLDLPLDAEQLCSRYGQRRGRPINVISHPLPAGMPNGVWLAASDGDYFFCQANTSPLHRNQIIIHEFGHLIAGHQMLGQLDAAALLAPSEEDANDALSRTCYSDEREWEAEMLASIIVGWAADAAGSVDATVSDDGLRRIQRLLGGHGGWM